MMKSETSGASIVTAADAAVTLAEVDDDVALRAYVDCDGGCGRTVGGATAGSRPQAQSQPLKTCSKCHCTFYCSVECQRKHWHQEHKHECRDIKGMREAQALDGIRGGGSMNAPARVPVNTACGICLEEPIPNGGVVLSQCNHAFCLPCLQAWQTYRPFDPNDESILLGRSSKNKSCPYCRKAMDRPVVDEIMEVACLYASRARKLRDEASESKDDDKSSSVSGKNEKQGGSDEESEQYYLDLATKEVEKVFLTEPNHLGALFVQAQILVDVQPLQAVQVVKHALELDAAGFAERSKLDAQLDAVKVAMDAGDDDEAERLMRPIEALYCQTDGSMNDKMPTQYHGDGPYRLFPIYTLLAQCQEAAELWKNAVDTYQLMMNASMQHPQAPVDAPQMRKIWSGLSHCYYQLHYYGKAIYCAQVALSMNRHFPGVHKLIALPQRAIVAWKEGQGSDDLPSFDEEASRKVKSDRLGWDINDKPLAETTLDDVVWTMRRAVVYEAPWDDDNRRANRIMLRQYVQEAADIHAKDKGDS